MDSIKIQKHQAMKNYKMKAQIICIKIAVYSLAAFISSLFYLYLFWFPTMKHFMSMYLPSIYSLIFSSKFLFILVNLIVVILIGDLKLRSDNSITSKDDIYDEYFMKGQGLRHMKKQRPIDIGKNVQEIVMVQDKTVTSCTMVLHGVTPLTMASSDQVIKPVTSRNTILHGVTDPKKSTISDQVMNPLKTLTSCNNKVLRGVTDPKKSMASDQVLHPSKTVTSSDLVLHGVTNLKKPKSSETQSQRKRPKRHVHEKLDPAEDNPNVISSVEVVKFVDKVNDMELRERVEEVKGNGKEEEKIDVHHDSEGDKCNGKEEEEIYVYHDHDSVQRNDLNRRVEEFIARVNRRRMLEAGQLVLIEDSK